MGNTTKAFVGAAIYGVVSIILLSILVTSTENSTAIGWVTAVIVIGLAVVCSVGAMVLMEMDS